MAVMVGSARSDERGKANSGKAGDQNGGKEVSTQSWYKHSKGWRVFRPKDPEKAEKMGVAMKILCADNNIGYDQYQRNTLYNLLKKNGWDIKNVSSKVETDCSALVRVCAMYAGISLPDFTTANEAKALLNSGEFVEMKGSKYTSQSTYLGVGDVLVTCSKGHTVIVISNGSKYEGSASVIIPVQELGDKTLRNGDEGSDVKLLQTYLIELGYSCGKWGADGDFGDSTELAVEKFQKDHKLTVDGEYGPKTHAALMNAIEEEAKNPMQVKIIGGDCFIRTVPNKTGKKLGVAHEGEVFKYGGQTMNGWPLIEYKNQNAWVSGMYGKLID